MIKQIAKRILSLPKTSVVVGYQALYPFYKNQFIPSIEHQNFSVGARQIYGKNRTPGLSGYSRIYNEEDFLAASVQSHLPFFDELILVVDSQSTDNSLKIAKALAHKYPDKIKCFLYEPKVFKLRTKMYKILPINHPNSFINYCNYTLSKTTKNIVTKVDADHIAIDSQFAKITKNSTNADFMQNTYYHFNGINLWYINDKIYVDTFNISGRAGDIGFHAMRREQNYYTKDIKFENGNFMHKNRQWKNAGTLYFHLKNMRSNIPYQSYRGLNDKLHQKKFKKRVLNIQKHLVDWQTFINQYQQDWQQTTGTDIRELPDPNQYLKTLLKTIPSLYVE